MDFTTWETMDPHMLVGLLNTELRNHAECLDDLIKTHGLPRERLVLKMELAGYDYREAQRQFR
ncbi:DUF4250 domain-containing protein [Akkermansiaceae bacterium]|nr:DUF4250 domain-containing protein [Akkermansiaceae bacterium]